MDAVIVRVRPAASVTDGYSEARLTEVVKAATGHPEKSAITIRVGLNMSPITPDWVEDIAAYVSASLADVDLLLIDMNFDRTVPRGFAVCDILVRAVLEQAAPAVKPETRIVILLEALPTTADALSGLQDEDPFDGRLMFVTGHEAVGRIPDVEFSRLADALRPTDEDLVAIIAAGTLRRRGVFESRKGSSLSHYLFYYEALPPSQDVLIDALREYFQENGTGLVVFDEISAGPWFRSCIVAAGMTTKVAYLDARHLQADARIQPGAEQESVDRGRALLADEDVSLCVVTPVYRTGRTIMSLFERTGRRMSDRTRLLAVYGDDELGGYDSPGPSITQRIDLRWGGKTVPLDYVLAVPIRILHSGDWKVQAAQGLSEVERVHLAAGPDAEDARLGRIGMTAILSLFEEYGAGPETPTPSRRRPISHFPLLHGLHPWDAHWLAEMAVRRILDITACAREALLVVLPDEMTGARPIARALKERCQTAVMNISREVIENTIPLPDETRVRLRRHAADTVVVLDESTVTHSTLALLGDLVESVLHRQPDLYASIVDLAPRTVTRREPYFTYAEWSPLRHQGGESGAAV